MRNLDEKTDIFEKLLTENQNPIERFVKFRVSNKYDAEDIIQDVYITAYRKFSQLKNIDAFKPWIVSIARSKCTDYFREQARKMEIPIDSICERSFSCSRHGISETSTVTDTIEKLGDKDKQILYLYFWKELPQTEIALKLNIPVGTVKSRLHTAKKNFKERYPYYKKSKKGETNMKRLPDLIPEYKIEPSNEPPFTVKCEELSGWMIIPRQGEKLSWGLYESPSRKLTEYTDMEVTGKAEIHGIEGAEIIAVQHNAGKYDLDAVSDETKRYFVAQLTDTHCRYLAESHTENGIRKFYTFLDGDSFLENWGFGENNCGNEIQIKCNGDISRNGNVITAAKKDFLLDITGRYTVTINAKTYDTVCIMDIETYNSGTASEQYVDKNGRTVLWRRFNADDWAISRYGKKWSEQLPENERIIINDKTYIHWYDCISDYISD